MNSGGVPTGLCLQGKAGETFFIEFDRLNDRQHTPK